MHKKAIQVAAAAVAFACGAAFAQDTTRSSTTGGEYTKMDKDKDGSISKKEASKNKELTSQWDTLDVNKDGKLDEAEFAQFETSSMDSDMGKGSSTTNGGSKDDKVNY